MLTDRDFIKQATDTRSEAELVRAVTIHSDVRAAQELIRRYGHTGCGGMLAAHWPPAAAVSTGLLDTLCDALRAYSD